MARWAREQGHIPAGWYGQNVVKIAPHEIGYAGLHPGDADMIICATNKTRQFHNAAMRAWHGRSGPPREGDVVICLRNNYDEGLFNGQRGTILDSFRDTGRSRMKCSSRCSWTAWTSRGREWPPRDSSGRRRR